MILDQFGEDRVSCYNYSSYGWYQERAGYEVCYGVRMAVICIIPYPPTFNSTAARTIDLVMRASMCVLGSQKWSPCKSIFTINAQYMRIMRVLDQELLVELQSMLVENLVMF